MSPPLSIDDRIKFIDEIEILDTAVQVSREGPVCDTGGQDSASVDAGSSISFVGNLTGQMKADVLNSTLLAQLYANKKCDRQKATIEWYNNYSYLLESVGWNVQGFGFSHLSDVNTYYSVDALLLKLVATYLSVSQLALYTTMIEALRRTKNESATALFDDMSKTLKNANFQVGIASNSDGNAQFSIGAYYFTAEQNIDKVLFFNFESQKIEFYAGHQDMLLNSDTYSQVRERVLRKLGNNAKDLIEEIEL